MIPLFPEPYRQTIIDILTDASLPAYGDVATVDDRCRPHVRTVHLRYFPEFETFGFACNVQSPKWRQMEQQPSIAICYYDPVRQLELRCEGAVHLISDGDAESTQKVRRHSWSLIREHLRRIYWETCNTKKLPNITTLCPTLGFVRCAPELWDVYEYTHTNPAKARSLFTLDGSQWTSQHLSIIDSRPL